MQGEPIRESNARMVRWDDGSLSLVLGGEVFDVKEVCICCIFARSASTQDVVL